MKNIVLIGMPGCGKTTIGKRLAERLGRSFCDADQFLEKTENTTIKELFALSEEHFRDAETRTIKKLSSEKGLVIATGGGVVKRPENMMVLKSSGIIFFIDRAPELICGDIDTDSRPLLAAGRERIYQLYAERIALYRKYQDFCVTNQGQIETVVTEIIKLLKKVEK